MPSEKPAQIFILNRLALAALKAYRYILSPYIGQHCIYTPTCSCYSIEAFKRHSFPYAFYLTLKRLLRCNSLFEGGVDEVPQ